MKKKDEKIIISLHDYDGIRQTQELTKIKNKLRGQEMLCKAFYDHTGYQLDIKKQSVYLSSNIKELFELINDLFLKKNEEIKRHKKRYEEIEKLYIKERVLTKTLTKSLNSKRTTSNIC